MNHYVLVRTVRAIADRSQAIQRGNAQRRGVASVRAAAGGRFAELQARHPKWREVNLAASIPGIKRAAGAEAWLVAQAKQEVKPMAASTLRATRTRAES